MVLIVLAPRQRELSLRYHILDVELSISSEDERCRRICVNPWLLLHHTTSFIQPCPQKIVVFLLWPLFCWIPCHSISSFFPFSFSPRSNFAVQISAHSWSFITILCPKTPCIKSFKEIRLEKRVRNTEDSPIGKEVVWAKAETRHPFLLALSAASIMTTDGVSWDCLVERNFRWIKET